MSLPAIVGLCPVHADEFYVPHGGICPEPGCDRELAVYVRAPSTATAPRQLAGIDRARRILSGEGE